MAQYVRVHFRSESPRIAAIALEDHLRPSVDEFNVFDTGFTVRIPLELYKTSFETSVREGPSGHLIASHYSLPDALAGLVSSVEVQGVGIYYKRSA